MESTAKSSQNEMRVGQLLCPRRAIVAADARGLPTPRPCTWGWRAGPGLRTALSLVALLAAPWLAPVPVAAQTLSHTISLGDGPIGVAVNPATNTVYAATVSTVAPNSGSGALAVINGTTNTLVATVPIGDLPVGVAVNAATNTVYVPRQGEIGRAHV